MKNLQKMGGIAALYEAAAYMVAMVGFLVVVDVAGVADPVQQVTLLAENQTFLTILYLITYVLWGFFMIILSLALYERLKAGAPTIAKMATAFGIIWAGLVIASGTLYNLGMATVVDLYGTDPAQAGTVWLTIDTVIQGLSGTEFVGSTWILLVSWAALRGGEFAKALNYLGIVIGLAGLLTVVPALAMMAFIFGLGQIVWFIWLGIVLLRSQQSVVAEELDAYVARPETT